MRVRSSARRQNPQPSCHKSENPTAPFLTDVKAMRPLANPDHDGTEQPARRPKQPLIERSRTLQICNGNHHVVQAPGFESPVSSAVPLNPGDKMVVESLSNAHRRVIAAARGCLVRQSVAMLISSVSAVTYSILWHRLYSSPLSWLRNQWFPAAPRRVVMSGLCGRHSLQDWCTPRLAATPKSSESGQTETIQHVSWRQLSSKAAISASGSLRHS